MRRTAATAEELDAVDRWSEAIVDAAIRFRRCVRDHDLDGSGRALSELLETIGPRLVRDWADAEALEPELVH